MYNTGLPTTDTTSERLHSVQNLKVCFFLAKSLNMPFKDKIQDSTEDLILIWNRHIFRELSIVFTVSSFVGYPVYLYQCFGRYELYDLHNQYVYKCIGVMVYILLCTRVCTQKLIIFTCVN